MIRDALFYVFAAGAILAGWRVFRADSMVRAAYWLLASFVAVGLIAVLLGAEYVGLITILMMAGEMTIMAIFMVMFMMNPAGLNPMNMVHQHRAAVVAGVASFLGLSVVGVLAEFPRRPADAAHTTAELGTELLGDSMLIFETAAVALLATMIGAVAIASRRGRYGDAEEGSVAPEEDGPQTAAAERPMPEPGPADAEMEHMHHGEEGM